MAVEFSGEIWYWRGPALFPKDGGYVVPVKDAVRGGERSDVGDVVDLRLDVRPRP